MVWSEQGSLFDGRWSETPGASESSPSTGPQSPDGATSRRLWPTPNAMDGKINPSMMADPQKVERQFRRGGTSRRNTTGSLAKDLMLGISPSPASATGRLWPTPSANQYECAPELWMARRERERAKHRNGNGFGLTLAMAVQSESISSPAASPASPSVWPDGGAEWTTNGGSGPSSAESFAFYDRDTSSWRTSQACFPGVSDTYSETWPRSGMTRNGHAYRRPPLVRLTSGGGSSSWPTPHGFPKQGQARNPGPSGNELGRAVNRWPTPTSRDHKDGDYCPNVPVNGLLGRAVWPTPKGSPSGPDYARRNREGSGGDDLVTQVGGSLNPTWVEWLMGFPLGWTDLEGSETPSSPKSPKRSGG